jgi:predicted nucleotidyltransferase
VILISWLNLTKKHLARIFNGYFDTVTSLSVELCSLLHQNVDLVTREMLSPHIAPEVLKEVRYIEEL